MAKITSVTCELHCFCGATATITVIDPNGRGISSHEVGSAVLEEAKKIGWESHIDRQNDLCPAKKCHDEVGSIRE